MKTVRFLIFCFTLSFNIVYGQEYRGVIHSKANNTPIEYVNVGIIGKNVGTVSDINGNYALQLDPQFDNDTLMFSCIGYYPSSVKVSDFKNRNNQNIFLKERIFELAEVVVRPKSYKQKTMGVSTKSKIAQAGFEENKLGYECGIMMKHKETAILETVNINFSLCSYDTIFYRLNIYKVLGSLDFENILQNPIYLKLPKNMVGETVYIDLKQYNITVQGDFLVTLEHVKNLGSGKLFFCSGLSNKTYIRKTSQGTWETAPIGISVSVDAKIEK